MCLKSEMVIICIILEMVTNKISQKVNYIILHKYNNMLKKSIN